jgi:hypothetical protein
VHSDGFDTQLPTGAQNSEGDFTSVRDDEFFEHGLTQ